MNYSVVYLSSARTNLTKEDIDEIMNISQVNNISLNISGFLVYHEGTFLQLLEGEEKNVKMIYNRVLIDDRHKNIIPVLDQETSARFFDFYHSGFKICDNPALVKELKEYAHRISKLPNHQVKKTVHLVDSILGSM